MLRETAPIIIRETPKILDKEIVSSKKIIPVTTTSTVAPPAYKALATPTSPLALRSI
jgi:hypothetical protein